MTLSSLIKRLEEAEGLIDLELDAEIDIFLFGGETIWKQISGSMDMVPASRRPSKHHIGGFANEHVPRYSSSIDAAISLAERVLPGCFYLIGKGKTRHDEPPFGAQIMFGTDEVLGEGESSASLSISLVLATLRAIQSKGEQP